MAYNFQTLEKLSIENNLLNIKLSDYSTPIAPINRNTKIDFTCPECNDEKYHNKSFKALFLNPVCTYHARKKKTISISIDSPPNESTNNNSLNIIKSQEITNDLLNQIYNNLHNGIEQFIPIFDKEYSNLYGISMLGNVISFTFNKIMIPGIEGTFRKVGLNKERKVKEKNIHELVIRTFLIRTDEDIIVYHKDNDKRYDHIDNLRYFRTEEYINKQYSNTQFNSLNLKTNFCEDINELDEFIPIRLEGYTHYLISQNGIVKNKNRNDSIKIKNNESISLSKEKTVKTFKICELMVKSFYGNSDFLIRHIDGNTTNYHISNLCYIDDDMYRNLSIDHEEMFIDMKVEGYQKLYLISKKGNIINYKRRPIKMDKYGYVILYNKGNNFRVKVSTLMMMNFDPNYSGKFPIDNIDNNFENNSLENLQYLSFEEYEKKQNERKRKEKYIPIDGEEFRPFPLSQFKHKVSNFGNILSADGQYLMNINGPSVCIQNPITKKIQRFRVDKIVMETFVGKSNLYLDHIDKNDYNFCLTNLRYMSIENVYMEYYASSPEHINYFTWFLENGGNFIPNIFLTYEKSFVSSNFYNLWDHSNNILPHQLAKNNKTNQYSFKCIKLECSHLFSSTLADINNGFGCPYCSNRKLCDKNDCIQCFNKSFQSVERSKDLSPENDPINTRQLFKNSNEKFYFICRECNHTYHMGLYDISNGGRCSYCYGFILCKDIECQKCYSRSFAANKKVQYWDYIKNKESKPWYFKPYSIEKFHFICENGHEIEMRLSDISAGNWCNFCKNKTEAKLLQILKDKLPYTIEDQKTFEWCKNKKFLPFDFYLYDSKILLELDGPHHMVQISNWGNPQDNKMRDIYKKERANENGYSIIRVLQEDVWYDKINWFDPLIAAIEKILHDREKGILFTNIEICSNEEYNNFYDYPKDIIIPEPIPDDD